MTLEDFFTLSEMKDGLTARSRVEELLSVMKKEKDSVIKNVCEATRQWTAVASTIAATENRDCLDLFIQLDGLWFIDRWLRDVQEFGKDISDSFVEESMTAFLRALEKLQIDSEMSVSSGVLITVKNLLGHNTSRVQDRARVLLDSWNHQGVNAVNSGVENVAVLPSNGIADDIVCNEETSTLDASPSKGGSHEENDGVVAANTRNLPPGGLDEVQPEQAGNLQSETTTSELPPNISSNHTDMEVRSTNPVPSSLMSKPVEENSSTKEELSTVPGEGTVSIETCSKQEKEEVSGVQKLEELSSNENQKLEVAASTSGTVEHVVSSVAVDASAEDLVTEAKSENGADANVRDSLPALPDTEMPVSEQKSSMDEMVVDHSVSPFKTKGQDSESFSNGLQGSSVNNFIHGKPEDVETPYSRLEESGAANEGGEKSKIRRKKSKKSKRERVSRSRDVSNRKISDIGLEYGLVDALQVACNIAQEVEREVIGGEGLSCSSSEGISGGGIEEPSSPESSNGNNEPASDAQRKEVSSGSDHSAETDTEEEHSTKSDIPDTEMRDVESSKATLAQEQQPISEKSFCDFDLNEGACSDEMEQPLNSISTPVSVVSASKAAAVPGLPATPLQFEGALGWKGSAATSAFRPASPRRNSDCEKMSAVGGSSSRPDCLVFDLNVAEGGEDKAVNLMLGKQITASSGFPFAESSQEANHRRSERFNLDLNSISEEGDAPSSELRGVEKQFFTSRNGFRSPSPASSSSSMLQRNFDLNDRPVHQVHQIDSSDPVASHARFTQNLAFPGQKPDDPVISIFGTKVEVNQRDFIAHSFLPNGKAHEPVVDQNIGRTGTSFGLGPTPTPSYPHASVYGYNGVATQPPMSYSPAMYGPPGSSFPYMVNSRGAPVMPPVMPYPQQQFIMNMNGGASLSLNGPMPTRSSFDLNSGFAIEGGNRDHMGLRQFMPSQPRSFEDHLRSTPQPSSSGIGEKRKEPDGGWEPYPFNYKQQFPWK